MTNVKWVEPSLIWEKRYYGELDVPKILEIRSDDFLPDFLQAMDSPPNKNALENPCAKEFLTTHITQSDDQINDPIKLFQPLHGCYYLVTASLICEQFGLPDKYVNLKDGESTSFVIRRLRNGVEQAWSETDGWIVMNATQPDKDTYVNNVYPTEELFPLHPVSVCTGARDGLEPCQRKIYYGYISTGNREKYIDKQPVVQSDTINKKITDFFAQANSKPDGSSLPTEQQFNYGMEVFDTKVIASWDYLVRNRLKKTADDKVVIETRLGMFGIHPTYTVRKEASLLILLDFIDILTWVVPTVYNYIFVDCCQPLTGKRKALYDFLKQHYIDRSDGKVSLHDALFGLRTYVGLLDGTTTNTPPHTFDLSKADIEKRVPADLNLDTVIDPDEYVSSIVSIATFFENLRTAIKEANAEETFKEDDERGKALVELIENQVTPIPASASDVNDIYVVRLVYDYDPYCRPVMSEPSQRFLFARFFDSDAPARMVRIEMPDIKLSDLRKFKHGVGIQMSPDLRRVMDGVHEGMLDGDGLIPKTDWSLGMICTFSIQIITLIALVVMFIFAIMLNIIFWWLAFLKICLPIPRKQ